MVCFSFAACFIKGSPDFQHFVVSAALGKVKLQVKLEDSPRNSQRTLRKNSKGSVFSVADYLLKDLTLFEILFLGTSASAPSAKRGLSAQIVKHNEYRFLVDCGEGTQRQILQSGTGFKNLTNILLTHGHLDHILGLGGLLSTFLRWEAIDKLDIFGGRSTLDRVHDLIYGVVLRGNQRTHASPVK